MICMTVRFWEYCRMKEILKLFLMPCFRFCTEGKDVKMTVKTFTVSPRYCLYTVVMGDIDDTTVHRGTKFSRYWYRRGHDTTGYFLVLRPRSTSTAVRGIFTVLTSKF